VLLLEALGMSLSFIRLHWQCDGRIRWGVTRQYEYNANDKLTMVTDENGRMTTYEYDKSRNHTGTTYANGDETTFTYNEKNDVTSYMIPWAVQLLMSTTWSRMKRKPFLQMEEQGR
jgi:YD repeat-containing protein